MKTHPCFRMLVMLTVWFYCSSLAMAGQVVTDKERSWARMALERAKEEKAIAEVGATNTLAVLYFRNMSGQKKFDALQKGLALMLITDLSRVDKIQVVERVRLQALLEEMNLGTSGLVDQATAPKVGRLLGAYYVADGEILESKITDLEIQPYLIDVPFKTVNRQPPASGTINDLFHLEKKILFGIVDQMNILLTPQERVTLEKPISASAVALMALFVGIDYSDRGDYENAANMYRQALAEDPNLQLASDALRELKTLGLISETTATPSTTVAAESGSGAGTVLAVGLGLAAVGAGVAVALSSSGGDDNDGTSAANQPATTPSDSTAPTASTNPQPLSELSCSKDSLQFTFSEPMQTTGTVTVTSPPDWSLSSPSWSDDRTTMTVSWSNDYNYCSSVFYGSHESTVTFTLSGFQDTNGNPLAEPTSFEFYITL